MVALDPDNVEHAHLAARLAQTRIGFLSTTRRAGRAQTVPVWFAWTGDAVVVFSGDDTAKLAHLRRNPECAFTLETADSGNDVVLLDATVAFVDADDPVVRDAEVMLADKYQLGDGLEEWRSQFAVPLVLRPTRIVGWNKPDGKLRYSVIE